jgi:hypothetical protein
MKTILKLIPLICILGYTTIANAQNKHQALFKYASLSKKQIQGHNLLNDGISLIDSADITKNGLVVNTTFTYQINTPKADIKIRGGWSKKHWYRHVIEINHSRFLIDKLWYGNRFKKETSQPIFIGIDGCYYFSFNHRKYVAFFINDLYFPTTSDINKILLLFDVSERQKPELITIERQACHNLDCFGDFDNDRQLDYASWNTHNNVLHCYSLADGKLKRRKNYYLFINNKKGDYWIEKSKSRWFFEID